MIGYTLNSLIKTLICTVSCALLMAGAATARDAFAAAPAAPVAEDPGVLVDRDARDLTTDIRPRPIDRDVADTALTFTNLGGEDTEVFCVGFDRNGRKVGRVWLKVPSLGLRYTLASDISRDRDFIGHVQCGAAPGVVGSVLFLGPHITDLPVIQPSVLDAGRIRFPLVATY